MGALEPALGTSVSDMIAEPKVWSLPAEVNHALLNWQAAAV